MYSNADISGLAGDRARQFAVQAPLENWKTQWLASDQMAQVRQKMAQFAVSGQWPESGALGRLFEDPAIALEMISRCLGGCMELVRDQPLAQSPFQFSCDAGVSVLQLASFDGAILSLITHEPGQSRTSEDIRSVVFADSVRQEIVLAGEAQIALYTNRAPPGSPLADLHREERMIAQGSKLRINRQAETKAVLDVARTLVTLRISRQGDGDTIEYDCASGRIMHRSSGNRQSSNCEVLVAALGAMKHAQAVPAICSAAAGQSDHYRWESMRQVLSLDTQAGFAWLTRVADASHDSLQSQALALRTQLVASYPVLANLEPEPCPE